jgi:tRNA U55 pseudouridine synthase TruB
MTIQEIQRGLVTMDDALPGMKEVCLTDDASRKLRNGIPALFTSKNILNFESIRVSDETKYLKIKNENGELFAIGKIEGDHIKTERVFLTKPKEVF